MTGDGQAQEQTSASVRIRVWDLPTRLFHWTLLAAVAVAWWSISSHNLTIHRTAGAVVAGLIVFRLWWGLFGASTARFSAFLKGPGTVLTYARGLFAKGSHTVGHNPMGGWSVAALILVLISTVGFGLFAVDVDGLESGPFASLVSFEQGRLASRLHDTSFDALKVLVVLHLAAIAFYAVVKRDNLVRPMVDGRKSVDAAVEGLKPAPIWAWVVGLTLFVAVTAGLIRLNG